MKRFSSYPLHIFAGIVIAACIILFLPAEHGLTVTGVRALAVFCLTIYWWIFVAVDWVSLLAVALFAVAGVLPYSEAAMQSLGNHVVLFLIASACLNDGLTQSGFVSRVLTWLISRKVLLGRPWLFLSVYSAGIYLVSTVLSYTNIAAIILPVTVALCRELNLTKKDRLAKCLFLLSMWSSLLGYSASPIGHSIIIIIMDIIRSYTGISISIFQWLAIAVPSTLLLLGCALLLCRFVLHPPVDSYMQYDVAQKQQALRPMDKRERAAVLIFFATILAFIFPDLFSGIFPVPAAYLRELGIVTPALIGMSLMAVIRMDGAPLLNLRTSLRELPWATVFVAAAQCLLSYVVTADATGISLWLQAVVQPLIDTVFIDRWVFIALFAAAATAVLTNFLSGVITMNILFALILPLTVSRGNSLQAAAAGMVIGVVTNLGVMTPPASLGASVFLSSDYLTVGEGCKYGSLFCICTILVGTLVVYPLATLLI